MIRSTIALAAIFVLLATAVAQAAAPESKVFVYVVYNGGSQKQRAFTQALLKKFNQLGFTERMKKRGVNYVEASYGSIGAAASYLHIGPDDIVYLGILMADNSDHMTREMYRVHASVPNTASDRDISRAADESAQKLYKPLADVIDNLKDKSRWSRQVSLLDWRSMKAGQVKLMLDGKDISGNKDLLPQPPYKRQNIHITMVPFSPALFKKLGAESAGSEPLSGSRQRLWIKKGKQRLVFEVGPQITDIKTYHITNFGTVDKKFISPISGLFAYPEINGGNTFVPLNLIIKTLSLPYDVEDDGMTETLTPKK